MQQKKINKLTGAYKPLAGLVCIICAAEDGGGAAEGNGCVC